VVSAGPAGRRKQKAPITGGFTLFAYKVQNRQGFERSIYHYKRQVFYKSYAHSRLLAFYVPAAGGDMRQGKEKNFCP
jgi:hypothetical protein